MTDLPGKWLTVDIGESTGYGVWQGDQYVCGGTAEMWTFVNAVTDPLAPRRRLCSDKELLSRVSGWEMIVIEDWQLYPGKAEQLAWDKQLTVRGLGALEQAARLMGRKCVLQPAKIKESAIAGGAEDLFVRPLHDNRHQNDATMHGVFWLARQGIGVAQAA